jgi:flagellin
LSEKNLEKEKQIMAINDISLTAGMRTNLLALQNTVTLLDRTQERLSTGKKVNSALDNPVSFFAAQALNSRATTIDSLKDAMGQGIQTITAANQGITAITSLIQQAQGIAQSAQSAVAGATTTLNGATGISTYGSVSIDLSGMTQQVTGSVSFQLTSGLTTGNVVTIGTNSFAYTSGTASVTAGTFKTAADLAGLISGITSGVYVATNSSGTITVVHSSIVTGDIGGSTGVVTAATQVTTQVTGDSITVSGGTVLTAGINFTSTADLVTALVSAGYTGAAATGNLVTAAKSATTVLLSEITSSTLTVAQGANEVRTYTSGTHTYTYTAGTDFVAGSTTAGTTVAGLLSAAIGNDGLGIATVSGATVTLVGASDALTALQSQYNTLLDQLTALAKDSGYQGKNLLNGDALTVKFEGVNLTVTGFSATATGLSIGQATTGSTMWTKGTSYIAASITQLDNAATTLSTQSSGLSSGLSIITTRQDFSTNMINTLNTGSDNLTLADTNEEGANMLMLQTRQSLGITALSLSSQAAQAVLKLFG